MITRKLGTQGLEIPLIGLGCMGMSTSIGFNTYAEGNNVVVHLNNYAVRIDGKVYDNEIVVLMKLDGGLIIEEREFLDTIHVNELFCGDLEK